MASKVPSPLHTVTLPSREAVEHSQRMLERAKARLRESGVRLTLCHELIADLTRRQTAVADRRKQAQ